MHEKELLLVWQMDAFSPIFVLPAPPIRSLLAEPGETMKLVFV
jgi:hypothetical protein